MFTIEHDFDATVITLIDEAEPNTRPLNEDVVILNFDDRIVVEQMNPDGDEVISIVLSMHQLTELRLALNLPEGNYRLESGKG
jgi:mitochondrial fission protein ELM1